MMTMPTQTEYQYRKTAYGYDEVCAAITDLTTAYEALCIATARFEEMFKARYYSHFGIYHITDKAKIDADYSRLSTIRQASIDLPEPPTGRGYGYNRSGGSQESYPVATWQSLAKRYRRVTAKMERETR